MRRLFFLLAVLLARTATGESGSLPASGQSPSQGTLGPADLPTLLAKARALHLAEKPAWLRLGYWRPRLWGGFESEADGPKFFCSPKGKKDPAAELDATLEAFFVEQRTADELDDATCRFPARRAWLADELGLARDSLPQRSCPRLIAFRDRLKAKSATLVFSSYFLNNPASSFGHTLLRLNRTEEPLPGRDNEILDYGVDYSATVDTANPVLYAFKGLFGFFRGEFHHFAYYYKVREYADYDSRDLWEYDLDLLPSEVERLVDHLWELGGTWFDYYYLDENCSYHVLGAIEAAAPRLDLVSWVQRPVVLPSDTLKALYKNPGLVKRVHYRPSMRTQFETRARPLSAKAADAVEALVAEPDSTPLPFGDAEKVAILDAATDLLDIRYAKSILYGGNDFAAHARQALLLRRAALRIPSPPLEIPVPDRPDEGHGSWRLGLGGGAARDGTGLVVLDARLCLHDLADPPRGYPDGAAIEFLPLRLRYAPGPHRIELDEAEFVRVISLNPVERFDRRPSWSFRAGAVTVRDDACRGCIAAIVEGGPGFDLGLSGGALDLALFSDFSFEAAPGLSGIDGAGTRVGLGPKGMARFRFGEVASLLAEATFRFLPAARPRDTHDIDLELRFHLARRVSLGFSARHAPTDESLWSTLYLFDGL